jgi:KipI family sensor histidine kinase inhibitor
VTPGIEPYGDSALLVTLGDRIDRRLNLEVHALAGGIRRLADEVPGIGSPVPAYASLLVPVDPLAIDLDEAARRLANVVTQLPQPGDPSPPGPLVEIPVRYGGLDGPDLAEVAAMHDLSEAHVAELHASMEYDVFFLGFAPGFAYLGPLPPEIATPRRATPRRRVPAGSVGIAADQTGVYPAALPGGWQLIGRTDLRMWDLERPGAALLQPGMRVRFVPLARDA